MTPDHIRALAADGESLTVEFKRGTKLNDDTIVEAVVCLANGAGGVLLLGVDDDGTITGLAPRHGAVTDPAKLQAMIVNRTQQPVATAVHVVNVGEKTVAVVEVPRMDAPVGTTSGKYVRRGVQTDGRPACRPYLLHEMLAAGYAAQQRDYAAVPARGAAADDLDPQEFDRFRRLCATGRGDHDLARASDNDVLKALRLLQPEQGNQLTLGAILLFGRPSAVRRFVPTAEVRFTELRASRLVGGDALHKPLLAAAEHLYSLLDARNEEQEVIAGLHRIVVPRLPHGVLRESIANALVHRDYTQTGPIAVQLTQDRLRVNSPGGFPPGISLANLLEDSRPRSPILAEAFRRAGIVDRAGRGITAMYEQLLRAGRAGPDYSTTDDTAVIVTVPTSDADLEMVRFVLEFEDAGGTPLTVAQLRLLHEIKANGPQLAAELAESLLDSRDHVRGQLASLAALGLVEPRGRSRSRRHHLSAAFYQLARATEYVRLQETDPIQQQHLVLSYVDQFGRITRGQAAQLCRLTPPEASALLRGLVRSGELELRGERRGAHYVRPGV